MKKKLWFFLLIIILFFALFLLFLPSLASTPVGKKTLINILSHKLSGKWEIGSLRITWFGPQKIQSLSYANEQLEFGFDRFQADLPLWSLLSFVKQHLALSSLKGTFEINNGHALIKDSRYPETAFSEFNAKVAFLQTQNAFTFLINSHIFSPKTKETGSLFLEGEAKKFLLTDHRITSNFKAEATNLPLFLLDFSPSFKKNAAPFLQEKANFSLKGNIVDGNGPLTGKIDAENFHSSFDGEWQTNIFTLRSPSLTTFLLTKEISRALLSDVNPFFLTGAEARNPITLRIDSEGFTLPLPFSWDSFRILNASLNMGKIICQNEGSLPHIFSLMKQGKFSGSQQIEIWFTPVDFSIEKGMLSADRMDFLIANSIHLCSWGEIDLVNDRLDMILGLTKDALQASFGIKGLPENYVMKVPIQGSTKNPSIDQGSASAKIATLLAIQTAGKKLPFGEIWGTIGSKFVSDSSIPPAKRPFPWER